MVNMPFRPLGKSSQIRVFLSNSISHSNCAYSAIPSLRAVILFSAFFHSGSLPNVSSSRKRKNSRISDIFSGEPLGSSIFAAVSVNGCSAGTSRPHTKMRSHFGNCDVYRNNTFASVLLSSADSSSPSITTTMD